ncbi:MAG: hypothetical protein EOL97_14420 [Spirochaetia bacterium]|nr:hypothetical protein [Spirochaetia bacterium]
MYYVVECVKCKRWSGCITNNIDKYIMNCCYCGNTARVRLKNGFKNVRIKEVRNEKEIKEVVKILNNNGGEGGINLSFSF